MDEILEFISNLSEQTKAKINVAAAIKGIDVVDYFLDNIDEIVEQEEKILFGTLTAYSSIGRKTDLQSVKESSILS